MKKTSVSILLGLVALSACAQKYPDQRPAPQDRLFVSEAVEAKIAQVAPQLTNPYFFKGKAGEGIGGPHIGTEVIWPMSIMMKAFTATDDAEIKACMEQLLRTDAGLGFIHESFHKDDAANFTRPWFAWQNTGSAVKLCVYA